MRTSNLFLILLVSSTLTACGATASKYRPIVDGGNDENYEIDLASCGTLSKQKTYLNDNVKTEAARGAAVGVIVGALEEGSEGAIGGAILGSLIGGGERAWETRDERKNIILECMKQRGHRVVG